MTPGDAAILPKVRLVATILLAIMVAARVVTHGLDLFIVVSAVLLAALGAALHYVERHTVRPRKNYWRWLVGAIALGLVLVLMPLVLGANLLVGLILWLGLSAAGLAWCIVYERTEPF